MESKKNFTIKDVVQLSHETQGDYNEKLKEYKINVVSAKAYIRENYEYEDKQWKNSNKNNVKFYFTIEAINKKTNEKKYYDVVYLIHDTKKGVESTFQYRVGNMRKYKEMFSPNLSKEQKGLLTKKQLEEKFHNDFFYSLEFVLKQNNLLYGINRTDQPPLKRNPKMLPYLEKYSWEVLNKYILPILSNPDFISKTS